jgi:hypothetical protein
MKHAFHFLLIFLFCFTLASCGGGDEAVQPTPDPVDTGGGGGSDTTSTDTTVVVVPVDPNPQDGAISPIPETFTQKIVIEEATGTWCGWCPMGTAIMDKYIAEYPSRVYGVAIHSGDEMENTAMINALDRIYNLAGYPSGLVNRLTSPSTRDYFIHPDDWAEALDKRLETTSTSVGLALETNINEADAIATVQAHVGFGKDVNTSFEYRVLIYLIEDGIVSPQQNYLAGDTRFKDGDYHKYYEAPAVITDYVHNHVAKRAFTALNGDEIGAENVGKLKKFKKTFQINLTRSDNLSESYVVAVVLRDGAKPSVLNVQKVKLGETQDWD